MTTPTSRAPASPAPGFLEGVLVAFVAALAGTLAQGALTLALPPGTVLRLTVAGLAAGYLLYLLGASRERIGKIPTLALCVLRRRPPSPPFVIASHAALSGPIDPRTLNSARRPSLRVHGGDERVPRRQDFFLEASGIGQRRRDAPKKSGEGLRIFLLLGK